jgi:hypothetical protein
MSGKKIQIARPVQGVIESPDGEIQYYTESINKHNPYIQRSIIDEENGIEYQEIECNGQRILIAASDLKRALELECKSTVIRLLCLIDFVMNLLIVFYSYYPEICSILISLISLSGYIATTTYNKSGLILYLLYQYLQTISKIIVLGFYIIATISPQVLIDLNRKGFDLTMPLPSNIGFFSLAVIGQIYINVYIQKFYYMLPRGTRYPIRSAITTTHI